MKRGLLSPPVHSALATTRRDRLQLLSVDQVKSLKRRAGLPVRSLSSWVRISRHRWPRFHGKVGTDFAGRWAAILLRCPSGHAIVGTLLTW